MFDGVEHPGPTISFIEDGLKHLKRHNILSKNYDFVISVGGGTNHDTARSIAALVTNGGSIADYEGFNKFTKPILPWVAINTTAGYGAHLTMVDVITDESRNVKMTIIDPKTLATITVNDPALHVTAPKEVTTSSGIDNKSIYRHHGLISGVLLPYVLEFNAPSIPVQRFIDMATAMSITGVSETNAVEKVLDAIRTLNNEINVPADLSEMGAKVEDIKYYTEMASIDIAGTTNPRQASLEEMIQLIRKSMKMDIASDKKERESALSRS